MVVEQKNHRIRPSHSKIVIAKNYKQVNDIADMEEKGILKIESLRCIPEKNVSPDDWKYEMIVSFVFADVVINYGNKIY